VANIMGCDGQRASSFLFVRAGCRG
jgi:hypothetical protein